MREFEFHIQKESFIKVHGNLNGTFSQSVKALCPMFSTVSLRYCSVNHIGTKKSPAAEEEDEM